MSGRAFLLRLVAVLQIIGIAASVSGAATYIVRPDGTGDFPTIQQAIDAAGHGDRILLADGVFTGAGNRDIRYNGKSITVRSQSGHPSACIIDCIDPFANHRGFWFEGEDPGASLRDLTIRNGRGGSGAGLYVLNASPVFSRVTIHNCTASAYGGGVYVSGGDPTFSYCYFQYCDAALGGGGYIERTSGEVYIQGGFTDNAAGSGAGLHVGMYAQVYLYDCAFLRNEASTYGGAMAVRQESAVRAEQTQFEDCSADHGGAIHTDLTALTLTGCRVIGNDASDGGAGICCENASMPVLEWTVVAENFTPGRGGGLRCLGAAPVIRNCTFYGNAAGDYGAGICLEYSPLSCQNTIIAWSAEGEAIYCYNPGTLQISCTDIYGNQGGDWTSCISSFQNINGNIRLDPQFCDVQSDLTIRRSSPCAPFSPPNPQCDLIGALGVGCPASLVEEAPALDESPLILRIEPNPSRGSTRIGLASAGPGAVRISIVDPAGRLVRELHSGIAPGGIFDLIWDGRNDAGIPVAAGIFLVRADSRAGSIARSLIVLR